MFKFVVDKIIWLDFLNPDQKDISEIKKIHNFHPIILKELLQPSAYARAEVYDGYIFFSYHLPNYNKESKTSDKTEIDFLVTKDHVVTVHYQDLEFLNECITQMSKSDELKNLLIEESTGKLVYYLIQKINLFCLRQLVHIEKNVDYVNKNIFANQEHIMLQEVSYIKRNILNYSLITKSQELALHSLKDVGLTFWGEPLKIYLANLVVDNFKINRQIENYRHTIESLEETNSQLLNSKTNTVMQRFTMLAFLTFPLALFTGIYNVPEVYLFLNNLLGGFWQSFFIMSVLTIATLVVFMNKNWF